MGCSSSTVVAGDVTLQSNIFDTYELLDVLGRGAFGTVRLAYNLKSQQEFAVKVLELKGSNKNNSLPVERRLPKDVSAEKRALRHIGGHPNVVEFRDYFVDSSFAYFVIELCTSSLLAAWMNEPDLNENTYARYFKEMAHALAHIHSVGVVHRDVKQDNFMVGGPNGRTVKLCDFGLSAFVTGADKLSGNCGTVPYMAPEMVTPDRTHGPPADLWSLGVIVYNAFFGCWPYQPRRRSRVEMAKAIREGTVPPSFEPRRSLSQNVVSDCGIRFVKALLDRNPLARPSATSCSKMAYLDTNHSDQLNVSGCNARMISLAPELHAARQCGAFNEMPSEAGACK